LADKESVPSSASSSPFAPAITADEVVRQLHQLPSAPRVLPRLKSLLSDGNSSMHEVVNMIRLDPGIAARVLQMGNSAYYSQGMRCYTVDEAVNRVGYDQVYELVANAVASQVLVRPLVTYSVEADQLWQLSIACALAAESLAERNRVDCDIAYTVGLLHGVGLVAIDEWAFRQHPDLRFSGGELPLETCEVERATLGFHNAEAGASLLRLWEFPAVMSEPVRWQYLPRGTAAHFQLACILHVAKWIRTRVCQPQRALRVPDSGLLRTLNLTPDHLEAQAGQIRERMEQVRSLLETEPTEKTILTFPNGEREIAGPGVSRTLMNRYA